VDKKKIDPITPSDKEKGDEIYSVACKIENRKPRMIVINSVLMILRCEPENPS